VRIAVDKAHEHGHDLTGAVLASDAFFPFPDGPEIALEAGIRRSSNRAARSGIPR
jgi:phosphoribosylaminoimidazolecarboxamide formyltransferase / IMP cyclohydrolase